VTSGYLRYAHIYGDLLAFAAHDDVWLAPAGGGRAWRLTDHGAAAKHPRFSPDGNTVAWTSGRDGAPEIYLTGLDGPTPERLTYWGDSRTRLAGWTAGREVLAITAAGRREPTDSVAYAIPAAGGQPRLLPYGQVNDLALDGPAVALLTARYSDEPSYWKRYRGGTAGRLWTSPDGATFTRVLADLESNLSSPMLIGGRLYFLSDHEGTGNIYSVALDGGDIRRHTHHDDFYVRNPATDGTRIVYHVAGDIWLLEDGEERRLDITLSSSPKARAPRLITAKDHLGGLDVDQTGQASAVEVRGTIHWLTHKDGPARALYVRADARAQLPATAAGTVFWVTDEGGWDALAYAGTGGDGSVVKIAEGLIGDVTSLAVSPDGATVVTAARDGRLFLTDVATGTVTELAASRNGEPDGLAWSPDSQWVAWSQPVVSNLRQIRLARRDGSAVIDVTDGRFADTEPVFTLDGQYLAFLSKRTFDPVYDAHTFDLSFPYGIRPYLAVLAGDAPSPFGPLAAGRPLAEEKADDTERRTETVVAPGVASRVVAVPVEEARYSELAAVEGGLAWLRTPVAGVLGEGGAEPDSEPVRPRLERFDIAKRSVSELAAELDWYAVSGDGKRIAIRDGAALRVIAASGGQDKDEPLEVDLARARFTADPGAIWRHAYEEMGRLIRRDYWTPDMSGVDWDAVLAQYAPLVDRVGGDDDFNDLLWETAGELGTSHAYANAPEPPAGEPKPPAPGQLGADLERTSDGRWIVSRVLPGESSDPLARSPLEAPGAGVVAGDEIVAVDGQPVDPVRGPGPLLSGAAGKPVELTVRSAGGSPRSAVVVPLHDERRLRYQDWVADRRRAVRSLGDGRLGYLHVPDMVGNGWAHFHRDMATELTKDALIVDVRANSGGHTSELVLEKLVRRVIAWDSGRYLLPVSYPSEAARGPIVVIADEFAGSDGDIITAAIKINEIGPVVGARTWGGVVGFDDYKTLVDGTRITVPQLAFWFTGYGWDVENHGVDPDVEVLIPPGSDADPQLETAVRLALEALEKTPAAAPPVVPVPGAPSKARPPLPPA
jgi:tricorn protease